MMGTRFMLKQDMRSINLDENSMGIEVERTAIEMEEKSKEVGEQRMMIEFMSELDKKVW